MQIHGKSSWIFTNYTWLEKGKLNLPEYVSFERIHENFPWIHMRITRINPQFFCFGTGNRQNGVIMDSQPWCTCHFDFPTCLFINEDNEDLKGLNEDLFMKLYPSLCDICGCTARKIKRSFFSSVIRLIRLLQWTVAIISTIYCIL